MLQSAVTSTLAPVVNFVQPWQTLYADHSAVSTAVIFVHLSALVASAGLAVTNDRAIVRTKFDDADGCTRRLADLAGSHRSVLTALAASFASGILLFLADLEAFVIMPAFWVKMSLILLLIVNATFMVRREKQLRLMAALPVQKNPGVKNRIWTRLRSHAFASLVLWFAIVLAGTTMTSG
ncbi:MAG: hypothetical protein ABI120_24730 [Gemmatimonadaceae bacterium]